MLLVVFARRPTTPRAQRERERSRAREREMRERRANETNDERKQCELLQYRAATTPKPTIARLPIPAFARERAKRNLGQARAIDGSETREMV